MDKRVSDKSSYLNAFGTFNSLPNDLKILNMNKQALKTKLIKWIKENC